ncbi:MAG: tetratricopeptide repeat protein [Hyphomicrobiaceae bacterium]
MSAMLADVSAAAPPAGDNPAAAAAAALARGELNQAVLTYSTALAETTLPNDRRAMLLNDRAVAYGRLGQTRQAFEDFNKAVQLFPEYAAIYNNRGSLLLRLGQSAEAVKDFDRALVLAPGYAAAYNNRAGALMGAGDTEAAVRDFTQAVRLLPAAAPPLAGRGIAHLSLGRPHAAIRDFSRAVKADTTFALGYRKRAEAKLAVGHFDEAIEDLSRAVAFDITSADTYRLRGRAYLLMGDTASAIKDLSRAIELAPADARIFAERGLAHARTGSGSTEEAMADLSRAIEIDPRNARAFAYRAIVYKEMNQTDVGMKDIATAVRIAADDADVLWAKAEIEEAVGQRDQALADLKRAVFLDPAMRLASQALERLDGDTGVAGEITVSAGGQDGAAALGGWGIVKRGGRYFAVNPAFRRLDVPLEMMSEGQPRLVSWEERPPPHRGIGVLVFDGGAVDYNGKPERTEFAAIVNAATGTVLAIEPHRQGAKVAKWAWNDTSVSVETVDGVTDDIQLQPDRRPMAAMGQRRRFSNARDEQWQPWDEPWAGSRSYERRERPRRRQSKTLFDLLFN